MGTSIEVIKHSENGRTALYQWDTGRRIKIQSDKTVEEVHFSNVLSKGAFVVKPNADVENGAITADIPNILLQTFMVIDVWIVCYSENGEYTNNHAKLDVAKRTKPSDYVYTETEVYDYRKLEKRIEQLEKYGSGGISEEEVREIADDAVSEHNFSVESHADLRKQVNEHEEFIGFLNDELKVPLIIEATPGMWEGDVRSLECGTTFEEIKESLDYAVPVVKMHDSGNVSYYEIQEVQAEQIRFAKTTYASENDEDGSILVGRAVYCTREKWYERISLDVMDNYAKKNDIPTKPEQVGAEPKGTADAKVSEHNVSDSAHNDIRLLIKNLTTKVTALLDSDDETLDQTSEIVAYIKSNKSLIDAITTSKVSVDDIVDNLTTNLSDKPLSAKQGVTLKTLIDEVKTALGKISIPTKLPNPQKLTFDGAVSAEYDGSGAVVVTIPSGQGTQRIEKDAVDTEVTLEPNKLYIFPEMATLNITLSDNVDASVANEFHFVFQSGATATTLALPETIVMPDGFSVDANKIYEISILETMMLAQSWAVN